MICCQVGARGAGHVTTAYIRSHPLWRLSRTSQQAATYRVLVDEMPVARGLDRVEHDAAALG